MNRPVAKVINLLKDMTAQLEKEGEEDEEVYDKMVCWCETNDKEKTKAIADGEANVASLSASIEDLTANSAKLTSEIAALETELGKNQAALSQATAMRTKDLAVFNGNEKDAIGSIASLKSAVTVLGKHNTGFLQNSDDTVASVTHVIKTELKDKKLPLLPSQRKTMEAFLQSPSDFFSAAQQVPSAGSYAPQSGEIFGILRQMKETFENNLSQSQKDEMANQKAYQDLKAAKEAEIQAGQEQIDSKTQEKADTDQKNAQAKQDIDDTKASLAADEQFLMMLKEKCQMTDSEWEERSKTRALEMEACSKALAVLSSDDAHDLFTSTFNPALIQKSTDNTNSDRRKQVSDLLSKVARKLSSPRLATLAVKVRLDAFTRVKKAIDDMIAQLLQEKADEIKHKDFCVDEFNKNQLETEEKERKKADLSAKIEDLTMTIEKLGKAIETLKSEINEMQVQLKRAGEDREKQNKEFQATVSLQRETQKLLTQAKTILGEFYNAEKVAAMLQGRQEPAGPPPPAGFEAYKKNAASGGVMQMITQIIEDAKAMEQEAIKAEEDATKAYEDFVKDTNDSIETKNKDITNKAELKAKKESELVEAKEDKEATMLELEELSNYNAQLHEACDFVQRNFDVRQTARDEEVEALKQAKAILSGAKFEEFLQRS